MYFISTLSLNVPSDLLEQLHRNITANQLINYQVLKKQQFDMITWRREEMARLAGIEDSQRNIERSVAAIEVRGSIQIFAVVQSLKCLILLLIFSHKH